MLKKTLPIIISLLMLAAFLAGCTDGPATTATKSPSNTAAATAAATAVPTEAPPNFNTTGYPIVSTPVNYTCIVNQSPLYGEDWSQMRLYAYLEETTNVKIQYDTIPNSDWETKLNLTLASGNLPDFFYSSIGTTNIQKYGVEGGLFLNYADMIPAYMPNLMALTSDMPQVLSYVKMLDGGVYCLPLIAQTATTPNYTLFFRRDMLDEIGFGNPRTVDEFYNICTALKEHYGADFSPLLPTKIDTLLWCLFPAFGDAWSVGFGDQGDGVVTFNQMTDQYKRCIEFLHKLYTEGLLEKEIFTLDSTSIYAKIKDGKACFINAGTLLTAEYFESGKIEVEINPPMTSQWTDEPKISDFGKTYPFGMTIKSECEQPEVLLRWADIFYGTTEEIPGILGGMSIWLGIKGENWDFTEDGKSFFRITPDTDLSEEEYKLKYISPGTGSGYLNNLQIPVNNPTQEMKASQCLDNYFPYTKPYFPNNSLVYTAEEANRLATLWTDINTYVTNSTGGFISGTIPLDGWDEYVSTLEKMGIKEVLTLKQTAYDRFVAEVGQ